MSELPYVRAERGAEDKYRLTKSVTFTWTKAPKWAQDLCKDFPFVCDEGCLCRVEDKGVSKIVLVIYTGFHFAVSVAPNFKRALAGACLHDFIYKYKDGIAEWMETSIKHTLKFADYWFLSQMKASGFLLKRTYFYAVRYLGYWFSTLT
ncbi:MAG: hypothetical protein FJ006_12490 [Chloroflexi bacterium]|nr:hypothetical protein [Chloroflexota bacterium]